MIDFIKTSFVFFWYAMLTSGGMTFGLWLTAVIIAQFI